jgi:hypothetical protein
MRKATKHEQNPHALSVDRRVGCPHCEAPAMLFEDGSIVCVAEVQSYVPEESDGEFFAMQRAYLARQQAT